MYRQILFLLWIIAIHIESILEFTASVHFANKLGSSGGPTPTITSIKLLYGNDHRIQQSSSVSIMNDKCLKYVQLKFSNYEPLTWFHDLFIHFFQALSPFYPTEGGVKDFTFTVVNGEDIFDNNRIAPIDLTAELTWSCQGSTKCSPIIEKTRSVTLNFAEGSYIL